MSTFTWNAQIRPGSTQQGARLWGAWARSIHGDNIQLTNKAAGNKCNINICN